MALGATTNDVFAVILRGAMIPLTIGLALSVVAALLLSRLLDEPALWSQQQRPRDLFERGRPAARDRSSRQRAAGMAGAPHGIRCRTLRAE